MSGEARKRRWRCKLRPQAGQALQARLRSGGLILMGRVSSVSVQTRTLLRSNRLKPDVLGILGSRLTGQMTSYIPTKE